VQGVALYQQNSSQLHFFHCKKMGKEEREQQHHKSMAAQWLRPDASSNREEVTVENDG